MLVSFDEFSKIELRVAKVIDCVPVENTAKLLKLQLSLGPLGTRQIASSIAPYYAPADLIGKKIVIVYNLDPREIRGVTSEGMLLAASFLEQVEVLFVQDSIPEGSEIH